MNDNNFPIERELKAVGLVTDVLVTKNEKNGLSLHVAEKLGDLIELFKA